MTGRAFRHDAIVVRLGPFGVDPTRPDDVGPGVDFVGVPELRDLRGHDSSMASIPEYANVIPSAALQTAFCVLGKSHRNVIISGNMPGLCRYRGQVRGVAFEALFLRRATTRTCPFFRCGG
ncbi:MAG: hypothetical protein QOD88_5044, partial [Mycobacterium sp.]|nr:hypothetical protein [Mycobacterium sp.]